MKTDTGTLYPKSGSNHRLPLPLIAHSTAVTSSLRWIRAKPPGCGYGLATTGEAWAGQAFPVAQNFWGDELFTEH